MQIQWPEGLDAQGFLRDYWQQRPLLMRGALPEFANPLSVDELAGLAMDEDIPSRLVWEHGTPPWRCEHGPFSEETLCSLPTSGWSLLVSNIDKHLPDFNEYLDPFRFIPDWRLDDLMISTAPNGGSVGPHKDEYDVFLLQAHGQREWSIQHQSKDQFIPDLDLKILPAFTADETWVLSPGDILYLPPGLAHHGVAVGDECMTWSVGYRAPSRYEMLSAFIEDHAEQATMRARFGDAKRPVQAHGGEITADAFSALRVFLREAMTQDDDALDDWIGRYLTELANPEQEVLLSDFTDAALNSALKAPLSRRSDIRVGFQPLDKDRAALFCGGESHECSLALAKSLCGQLDFPPQALLGFTSLQDRRLLHRLFKRQVLLMAG